MWTRRTWEGIVKTSGGGREGFTFSIEHQGGSRHGNVDGLSRSQQPKAQASEQRMLGALAAGVL